MRAAWGVIVDCPPCLTITHRMNDTPIEAAVRDLHARLWRARASLWPADALPSPVEMLDPAAAARLLGIEFEVHDELGSRFNAAEARFEIAGLLDRQAKKIAISRRFALETQRFTAAHELGHWLLHPGNVMHRDRPVGGLEFGPMKRPLPEREADRFAALFLMPEKLLRKRFAECFGATTPLVVDDAAAFWLCGGNPGFLLDADIHSLEREVAVASARSFANRHFDSLARHFHVSIASMAIRLRELGLVRA
jgi:Zn-dependent peptidase ImmA (M78 family)